SRVRPGGLRRTAAQHKHRRGILPGERRRCGGSAGGGGAPYVPCQTAPQERGPVRREQPGQSGGGNRGFGGVCPEFRAASMTAGRTVQEQLRSCSLRQRVGRTPWSAADAHAGLLAPCKKLTSLYRQRDGG